MAAIPIYANTLVVRDVTFTEGGLISVPINIAVNPGHGAAQLRAVKLLADWVTADITFLDVDPLEIDPDSNWQFTDGVVTDDVVIPGCVAGKSITTPPWQYDTMTSIKLVSSAPQLVDVVVMRLYLRPIYPGVA